VIRGLIEVNLLLLNYLVPNCLEPQNVIFSWVICQTSENNSIRCITWHRIILRTRCELL